MAYGPPPFMPFEPFLLGVGVVFNLLTLAPQRIKMGQHVFQGSLHWDRFWGPSLGPSQR